MREREGCPVRLLGEEVSDNSYNSISKVVGISVRDIKHSRERVHTQHNDVRCFCDTIKDLKKKTKYLVF